MIKGASNQTNGKKENGATKGDKPLQDILSLKCADLFRDDEPNQEAEEALFSFLSSLPSLTQLNFRQALPAGLHQQTTPLELIALYGTMINVRCLELIFDKIQIQASDLNRVCQGRIFIKGTTLMHLVLIGALNTREEEVFTSKGLKCTELIFQNAALVKKINYNLKCEEGPYQGTSIFWMLCLLVLRRNKKEYLEKLFRDRKIREKLNFHAICERDQDKHTLNKMLLMLDPSADHFNQMVTSLCASYSGDNKKELSMQEVTEVTTSLARAPLEQDEPYAGLGIPHLLADLAAQGHPTFLHYYLNTQKPNADLLNGEILAGPLRGISLFYVIAFAELTSGELFLDKIPLTTLTHVDLNKKMGGEMNPGVTPFYWLAALVSKGRTTLFENIVAKYPHALNFRITSQHKNYKNISILWWLAFAAAKGHPASLERLLQAKKQVFLLEDFVRQTQLPSNETSPLYWLIRAAMADHAVSLDLFFKKYPIQEIDFNVLIVNEVSTGTTLLWWLAYAALLGMPKYLNSVLEICPLEKLNFHAKCETTESYGGWSVLQLMAEAMYKGHGDAFLKVLTHLPPLPLDIYQKQTSGKNVGLTVFHQITQIAGNGNPTCLNIILKDARFKDLCNHLNDKIEKGPNKGVTPAWWLAAASLLQNSDYFSLLFQENQFPIIDFNAHPEKKDNMGISVLAVLVRAGLQKNTKPLELVFNKVDLSFMDFNLASQEEGQLGTTPLWWFAILAAMGFPKFLEIILLRIPLENLNLDARCLSGEYEGTTPLWWIVKAAILGEDNCLKLLLAKANVLSYDLQAKLENQSMTDHSVILGLAALGYCDIVNLYLQSNPIHEIDFNLSFLTGKFAGTTLLWWIAAFAVLNEESLLEKVLNEVPLCALDFEATNSFSGKNISALLAGTKWEKILPFFMLLKKSQEVSSPKDNFADFDELEIAAREAETAGFPEANVHMVRLCLQRGERTIYSRLVQKILPTHPNYQELSSALKPFSQNEETASLDDLCQTLSEIKLCSQRNVVCLSQNSRVLTFSATLANDNVTPLVVNASLVAKPRFRSVDASHIHSLVMRICRAKEETYVLLLQKLSKFLQTCAIEALTELSINGFSHLDDTHLVFAQLKGKLAETIAIHLFITLKSALIARLKREKIAQLLCNKPTKGSTLFHMAIKTRSVPFLKEVIAMHKAYFTLPVWQKMLNTIGLPENNRLVAMIKNESTLSYLFEEEVREAFGEENPGLLQKCTKARRKNRRH